MEEYLNPIAEKDSPDSGQITTPKNAYSIRKESEFYCPDHDCLDPKRKLIPAKSKLGNYFFKHKPKCTHEIRPETLLHKLAVKWFETKEEFEIPQFNRGNKIAKRKTLLLNKDQTILEYRRLERIIPDVKLTTSDGFEFAIEIFVTSDIKEYKKKLIEKFDLPTVRIDLSGFYETEPQKCRTDYNYVQQNLNSLLIDINLKSWVIGPREDDSISFEEKSANNIGCFLGALTLGLIYLFTRKK